MERSPISQPFEVAAAGDHELEPTMAAVDAAVGGSDGGRSSKCDLTECGFVKLPTSLEVAADITHQLLLAIEFLHSEGMVHRVRGRGTRARAPHRSARSAARPHSLRRRTSSWTTCSSSMCWATSRARTARIAGGRWS